MSIQRGYRIPISYNKYLTGKILITILYAMPEIIKESCVIPSVCIGTMGRYTLKYATVKKIKKLTKMRGNV